jgi:imidazolonepropionase-like amidohydrolase
MILDYRDATILPGLVDAHMHLASPGDGTSGEDLGAEDDATLLLRSLTNARVVLSTGITALRENGNKNRVSLVLRAAIEQGVVQGPRIVACGRPICTPGGHLWFFGGEAQGVLGVRDRVRQLIADGADWIKITATGGSTLGTDPRRASFTPVEMLAICDEARAAGTLPGAHATATAGVQNALDAGVDMLIHCDFQEADGSIKYRPDLTDRAVEAGIWINPTLYVRVAQLEALSDRAKAGEANARDTQNLSTLRRRVDASLEATRKMLQAGARIVAGSDTPWRFARPAGGLAKEIQLLASVGMTNVQALSAATSDAAVAIGLGDVAGAVAVGREADLVVVEGNPLADLRALGSVLAVFVSGVLVGGAQAPDSDSAATIG